MSKLYYSDGRLYDPPENPLSEKWDSIYESVRKEEECDEDGSYSCIWCDKCPNGSKWVVPAEDKEVFDKWQKEVDEYQKVNGDSGDVILPFCNNYYVTLVKSQECTTD